MPTLRIPLTQGLVTLVDEADHEQVVAAGRWSAHRDCNTFYATRNARRDDGSYAMVALHTFLTGWPLIDHINGDGLDNRRANLRQATHAENMRNRRIGSNNTSGFKGVSLHKASGRWVAQICADNVRHHLGYHDTPTEAAIAYDAAARELHGEFAWLNFPKVEAA